MISIIIPVYNAEAYLRECLDSVISQRYEDWELLLVDDGSDDSSGAICDEFVAKDRRVRVFHEENKGVSSARNIGLENAKGEWVTFVDSDDRVALDFCDRLLDKTDVDLVVSSFEYFGNRSGQCTLNNSVVTKEELTLTLKDYLAKPHFSTPWGKLFKRSILERHKLRFDKNLTSAEDTLFVYEYLQYVDAICLKNDVTYFYRQTGDGLSSKGLPVEKAILAIRSFEHIISSLQHLYNTDLSEQFNGIINIIYLQSIKFIRVSSLNVGQRMHKVRELQSQLPTVFLNEYNPPLIGYKGKIFYFLTRNRMSFLLTLFSYCFSI